MALVAWLGLAGACDGTDGRLQGVREPCATASGTLLDCDDAPIRTEEEACFRLVHCGAITLNSDEDWVFDWDRCVRTFEQLEDFRYELALACVQYASCDDLKTDNSPRNSEPPLCLDFGDQ